MVERCSSLSISTPEVALARLRAHSPLKVWSVLVTIFGDLAPEAGDSLSGPALAALTGRIGIRPEALRVALHRLRKDGWIASRKTGRISHYCLSASGREQTRAVRERIYASALAGPPHWFVVIAAPGEGGDAPAGALALGRQMFLCAQRPRPNGRLLVTLCDDPGATGWMREQILPDPQRAAFAALLALLRNVQMPGRSDAADDPVARMALRLLVLHHWRRLVLRAHPLAETALGARSPAALCRAEVSAWLDRLARAPLCDLDPAA